MSQQMPQENEVDAARVIFFLQEEGKKNEVVRLALDNALKDAVIEKQQILMRQMDQMLSQQAIHAGEKTKLQKVKDS